MWRFTLGWYVSRFQRFCRFAAQGFLTGDKEALQIAFALQNANVRCEQVLRNQAISSTESTGSTVFLQGPSGSLLCVQ